MTTSPRIADYLARRGVDVRARRHPRTMTASQAAHAADVPERQFAKTVVLTDDDGPFLAVLPAARAIVMGELWRETHRPARLATEGEIAALFPDCDLGAIPPFGEPYELETVVDDHLLQEPTVYCEGGDHETILELDGAGFAKLLAAARPGSFGQLREAGHPS